MRIKFRDGKQKELINVTKKRYNFTWKEFAEFLGISTSSLLELSREKNLLPSKIYDTIDKNGEYKSSIVKINEDNWGRKKGGLNSKGSLKQIKTPKNSKELAELVGIILGDGNILSYKKGSDIGVYHIRIAGDCKKDKDYHLKYIKPLCEKLFGINVGIHVILSRNERFVSLYGKRLVFFFEKMGLKPGNKIKNKSTIPRWVKNNPSFLQACVRGLIDTDGSIFRMSNKNPHLLRINFKNSNYKLLEDTRSAFIKLGFRPSRVTNGDVFYISKKEDIVRYINEIGFSNQKHICRLQNFVSPVV